nr:retrotransposon protein, putative, Ty1-copia subclass [Tanacetum cinerariifolium]
MIVLSIEDKLHYLEQPIPPVPVAPEGQQVAPEILKTHNAWIKGSKEIAGLMLMSMDSEIQQNLEPLNLFEEGQSVSSYVLKMKGYIKNLERLGHPVTLGLDGLRASRKLKPGALSLYVGNGQREAVEVINTFYLCLPSGLEIVLNNCHYAPSITRGVISVSRLYEDGFVNRFVDNRIQVSRNNVVYFSAVPKDGIFEIDLSNSLTNESSIYAVSNKRAKLDLDSALLWHCRLGHISKKRIEKLQHDGLLNSSNLRAFEKCVSCMFGKMARKPYTHQVERTKYLLGLIHTDVCGPFKIISRQGASYFVTFTDEFSRYGYVYLLKHKHEVFETFKVFQKEVENQLGKTIKSLRFVRGGEYMSQEFLDHLKDHGIIAYRTPPYTPQHNGVSERRNRTLLDMVKKTPYEVWHGKVPKLSYLKVWGCEALDKRDTLTKPDKLEPRSIKCIFVGYPKETMGYSFYYPPENKVFVARNAKFLENSFIDQEASASFEDLKLIQEEDTHPSLDTSQNHEEDDLEIDEPQSDIVPICRSTRTRHALDRMYLYIDAKEHELGDLGEPANYKAALLDPESEKWLNAMNVEMQSMKDNKVWVLVELPPNGKTVGSKWLFKKKTDMDGNVHIYKARLVAKDYTQTSGIDYEETFSPVADIRAIRILIAIVAYYDYKIWKMDVKIVFLNGYLNEEVYMEKPKGFVNPKYPNREKLKLSKLQGASTPAELKRMQNVPYASAVGFIMNTKDMFLVYEGDQKRELRVSCYTDVGYLTDAANLKSQTGYVFVLNGGATGYVFVLNGGAVDWKSAKQSIFATSSIEAEYIATFDASKEAVWVRKFISGLRVVPIIEEPISMYCDNTGAITIANESGITKDYPKKILHFLALDGANEKIKLLQAYLLKDDSFDDRAEGCDDIFHNASPSFLHTDNRQVQFIGERNAECFKFMFKGDGKLLNDEWVFTKMKLNGDAKTKMGGPNGSIRNKEKYWHTANNGSKNASKTFYGCFHALMFTDVVTLRK